MRTAAKISVAAVVFGQLGFSAAQYYLGVPNPSWPFWILLFGVTGVVAMKNVSQISLSWADVWFFAFIAFVVGSFMLVGQSNPSEFTRHLVVMCVAPYLCGWILGKFVPFSIFGTVRGIACLYVVLIAVEVVRNPSVLALDRPALFLVDAGDRWGGDPTLYNIGTTLGGAWVMAFASLTFAAQKLNPPSAPESKWPIRGMLLGFPLVLVLVGSRSSMVAVILCALTLLACAPWVSMRRKLSMLFGVVIGFPVFYKLLPEARKVLINDIPVALSGLNDYLAYGTYCSQSDGSVFDRVVLLREAWQMFRQSPVFGIGAANYGLRWCGTPTEFAGPHSIAAQVLSEYGLVGFTLFTLMGVQIFRMFLWRMRSGDHQERSVVWGLFALWVFVLIQAQFIGNMYEDYQVFLLTGLLASVVFSRSMWLERIHREPVPESV